MLGLNHRLPPCEGDSGGSAAHLIFTRHWLAQATELFESHVDYLELYDFAHLRDEDRFIAIGPIRTGLGLVVWTERFEVVIRIISARWATKREIALYREYMESGR